ncbi:MAG: LysM peptidoglycan-binding domain-containing protein [Anaerolineae bacterium]|nr:LysM peptidoglycan-binding domain-containing protein [Anaerolineae bacterium]
MKKYLIFISIGLMIAIMLCCLSPGVLNVLVDVASFFVNLWKSATDIWATATPTITPTPGATPTVDTTPSGCPPPPEGWIVYTVQSGDTLYRISKMYNTSVDEIMTANCITDVKIYVGQNLYVPAPAFTP